MTDRCSHFKWVSYESLSARQKEVFNFHKVAATLADYGFNCIKSTDDWQGADFFAYHVNGNTTLKVQLKARVTVGKKYSGKDIWIAFPHKDHWYLIGHDRLVEKIHEHADWLNSPSWKDMNGYSSARINAGLLKSLADDKIGPMYGKVLQEDQAWNCSEML